MSSASSPEKRIRNSIAKQPYAIKPDFSALAYAHGFADQAHFIREFRSITGNSPGTFTRERDKFIVNPHRVDAPLT